MKRRDAGWALAAFILALGLRAGTALLTEVRPLFPDYYYNDARMYDGMARDVLASWESDGRKTMLAPGTEGYALWVAALYKATAPVPLAPKLFNSFLGALSALAWGVAATALFGSRTGLLTATLVAVWPSHVFFTSQNFKEAPGLLFLSVVLTSWVIALRSRTRPLRYASLACGAVAMALSGVLRPHLSPFYILAAAAGAGALAAGRGRKGLWPGGALLAASLAGAALYSGGHRALRPAMHGPMGAEASIVRAVESFERPGTEVRPTTPGGITEYRQVRMHGSRLWSRSFSNREIETEFFPEARFETWLDVALFLPKASFYELFMPLPGLYPLAGKPGRILAAAENTAALLCFLAAVAGFWRARRRAGAWVLASFIVCLTPAAALFEFDLGSAARHRLQPLAAAVPFAAAWAVRLSLRRRAR